MARLTEEMVIARTKQSDLASIKKLNCWGAELGDVSLLRRMPNIEVLALSINKIRTLEDFAWCRRLQELYIRKNEIPHLDEIRHLRDLRHLTSLWLEENPCVNHPQYRMTVLRNLPNLEKLDNVPVQPEEVEEAMRRGLLIPDSDDEGYSHQEGYSSYRRPRSADSSPERDDAARRAHEGSDSELWGEPAPASDTARPDHQQCPLSPASAPPAPAAPAPHGAMSRSHIDRGSAEARGEAALRHSVSAHSVKECGYSYNNGVTSPQHYHDSYSERGHERSESYQQLPQALERDRTSGGDSARERDREYPSAVMAEHRGFTRRPVTRNSNLLSAVLCLVKELDYPSLEVAEMAVRCRMDELANGQ